MPWITLRNKRRVKIDSRGRIVQGISKEARGVHVRDLSPFMSEMRELKGADCGRSLGDYSYEQLGRREVLRDRRGRSLSPRFGRKDEAISALLRDNPSLADYVEVNWGRDSQEYRRWLVGGMRGTKPQIGPGDGRFDPIDVVYDLRGSRRCCSMLEALYITVPSSRRWEDLTPDRLRPLEECVEFQISPPEEAIRLPLVREVVGTCQTEKEDRRESLIARARSGRIPPRDVPF